MHRIARALIATATVAAFGAATASIAATQDKDRKGKGAPAATVAVLLVPIAFGMDEKLGNGCWARLYDGEQFKGDMLTLVGPVDMPDMRTAFGKDWGGSFDSIAVGPKATLTVYDNEQYRDKAATIKAGQRVPDLDTKMGFFESIRSLKIACAK